jgi:hypothetical protein
VKTSLGAPLNSTWSLYNGDILFCEKNEEVKGGSLPQEYFLKEIIYGFNGKEHLLKLNDNMPFWKRVTSLFDGPSSTNLIPMKILLRDGLLEDITRDYKIKKILEEK